jgi:hypothetical protein
MAMNKIKTIAVLIMFILLLIGSIIFYRSCSKIIKNPFHHFLPSHPSAAAESNQPIKPKESTGLFGTHDKDLIISVAPGKEPVKIKISDNLQPSILSPTDTSQSRITIESRSYLIRFHPTLHITYLIPLSCFRASSCFRGTAGLKIRILEIWRFSTCAYLTASGFGPGLDFKLISNLSLDYVQLLTFKLLDSSTLEPLTLKPYFGLSLKL